MAEERNQTSVDNQPLTFDQLVDQITSRIVSQKKINRPDSEIKDAVVVLVKYIQLFNSFDQFTKSCFNEVIDLSEIKILSEFKDLIYPASVKRIAGSYLCQDVLIRTQKCEVDDIDAIKADIASKTEKGNNPKYPKLYYLENLSNYMECINTIRSFTKRDAFSDVIGLDSLKLEVSIDSIVNKMSYNNQVRVNNEWFYPIPVNTNNDFGSLYFNTSSRECADSYFSLLKVN